jgi:hypothetical protein
MLEVAPKLRRPPILTKREKKVFKEENNGDGYTWKDFRSPYGCKSSESGFTDFSELQNVKDDETQF